MSTPIRTIVLFAHGARDHRWGAALERLRAALLAQQPQARIAVAFLELQPPALPETLDALATEGLRHIDIAPVFWARGGHVAQDLPELVARFQARHPDCNVRILPVLAEMPGMNDFIARTILAHAG